MSRCAARTLRSGPGTPAPARSVSVIGEELVDDAFDNLPTPLDALSADALEHSSMRKVQIEEIQNALGTQAGAALEEVTFIYARAVYFIDRFMATMEPAGPRVPLDESSRIICDLIDVFERDPKAFMAVSMARPQVGNYDAFHQANTALLAIAGPRRTGRELLFELGMAGSPNRHRRCLPDPLAVLQREGARSYRSFHVRCGACSRRRGRPAADGEDQRYLGDERSYRRKPSTATADALVAAKPAPPLRVGGRSCGALTVIAVSPGDVA